MDKLREHFSLAGARAQTLRKNMTDAENLLWSRLRRKQMQAFKFRRQAPIGPDIADFACFELALVVELDGGQHATEIKHDDQRDAYMNARGYQVLRFWNNDVIENLDGVLETISSALVERSSGS